MDKTKPKTAIGRFIDQLPGSTEQLLLNPKKENKSEIDRFGESLIFELPSGKKVKFIAKLVDPRKCKIWNGNVRLQEFISEENTNDLKERINAQGQLVPVLARPIKDDPQYSHEIIYGSRRHYVCSSLGKNIKILEADLDDSDALIFMDAENSGREDLSPYEMAMAYKFWIDNGIFKSQGELSEQLGITRSWLNKIISLTRIPKEVISAISGPRGLSLKYGLEIVRKLSDGHLNAKGLVDKSIELCNEGLAPEDILQRLLNIKEKKSSVSNGSFSKIIYSEEGKPAYKITSSQQGKTVLTFSSKFPRVDLSNLLNEIELIVKKLDIKL
jgi:ParB/RepB/Spo0J family partition protein